mgnify:FL=1
MNYFNTFEYETKDDILYFILFVIEQNKLINDETKINLIVKKELHKENYSYLTKFIKNTGIKNIEFTVENIVIWE